MQFVVIIHRVVTYSTFINFRDRRHYIAPVRGQCQDSQRDVGQFDTDCSRHSHPVAQERGHNPRTLNCRSVAGYSVSEVSARPVVRYSRWGNARSTRSPRRIKDFVDCDGEPVPLTNAVRKNAVCDRVRPNVGCSSARGRPLHCELTSRRNWQNDRVMGTGRWNVCSAKPPFGIRFSDGVFAITIVSSAPRSFGGDIPPQGNKMS